MKINVVNIFVMTPIQISPGTVDTADHTQQPISGISLASTKLIKLISWRKRTYLEMGNYSGMKTAVNRCIWFEDRKYD
jgi:hypothetical protein